MSGCPWSLASSLGWLGVGYVLLGVLRGEPHRRRGRARPDRDQAHGAPATGSPTASSSRSGAPWRCSPDPSSCGRSRTTRSEIGRAAAPESADLAERSPSAAPARPTRGRPGCGRAAWAKIRRAVQRKAAASSRCDRTSLREPRRRGSVTTPGTFTSRRARRSSHALLRVLRPSQRDVPVQLVEAEVGVHLVDGPLPERRHLGGDLLVAGEQGAADRVEVVRAAGRCPVR